MPGSDTSHFAKTFVGLARQFLHVPTGDHTFDSVTLGDADDVDHLVLGEDVLDWDGLFHETAGKVDLLGNRTTVQLNLVNVGLLLTLAQKLDLGMSDDADDGAVFLHLGEIFLDLLLAILSRPFLGIFGKSLLLGRVPVLVETATDLLRQMFGPNGLEGPVSMRRFDVTHDTDDHDGWRLDESHRLNDFLLVRLRSGSVHDTANMSHTSLIPGKGGEMNRLLGIILGKGLDPSLVVLAPLLGQETQVAVTRRGKFTVRHRAIRSLYILTHPYNIF